MLRFEKEDMSKSKRWSPTVGLEPTTTRLRALRSTDWARRAANDKPILHILWQNYNRSKAFCQQSLDLHFHTLCDPILLEYGQWSQNGSTNPYRVLSFRWRSVTSLVILSAIPSNRLFLQTRQYYCTNPFSCPCHTFQSSCKPFRGCQQLPHWSSWVETRFLDIEIFHCRRWGPDHLAIHSTFQCSTCTSTLKSNAT